jgi:phosphodiesterase/alkaline phosphatase D-like protein
VAERNINATTAQIVWETSVPATSWVDYGTKSGVYDYSAGNDDLVSTHVVKLEGLTPGTRYYYRVRVKDANEVEYTSAESSFVAVLKPKIENMRIKDVKPYEVTISWETNVETETVINWGKTASYGDKKGSQGMSKAHEVHVTGLEDNSEYHFQIIAHDEAGNEVADSDKVVTTPLDTEGPQILGVKTDILPIGADEATATVIVSWQTNKPASTLVEYDEGILGGKYTKQSIEDKSLNTSHTVIIKDLKPASSYHYKIVSKDKRGNVGSSPDHTFVTPSKEKSILQLILKSLEETFAWTRNIGKFFGNIWGRLKGK